MRLLIQRVSHAKVTVRGDTTGEIGKGLLVFLGVGIGDEEATCRKMAEKVAHLRIFEDTEGKMNLDVQETGGSVLVVSQFTLYGDVRKGNRPSFVEAAPPEKGEALYKLFCKELEALLGRDRIARGRFRAMMNVELINAGPVTIWLDTDVHK
jgi:D-tyrosyl-tRNA(Tyr) deacylase